MLKQLLIEYGSVCLCIAKEKDQEAFY